MYLTITVGIKLDIVVIINVQHLPRFRVAGDSVQLIYSLYSHSSSQPTNLLACRLRMYTLTLTSNRSRLQRKRRGEKLNEIFAHTLIRTYPTQQHDMLRLSIHPSIHLSYTHRRSVFEQIKFYARTHAHIRNERNERKRTEKHLAIPIRDTYLRRAYDVKLAISLVSNSSSN